MGQAASVLLPLGAQLIKGNGSTPPSLASGLNSSGSYYNLTSGGSNQPLIQGGFSTTTLLIIGGVALAALFLLKK